MAELDLDANIEFVDICLILLIKLRSIRYHIYIPLDKVFELDDVLKD